MQIALLVACSQEESALALSTQMAHASGNQIAASAASTEAAVYRALTSPPDVLLLEHTAGEEQKSWHLLSELTSIAGRTRVLLLCDEYTQLTLVSFVRRGVSGCLLKSSDPSLWVKAVLTVHRGETWFGRKELLQALRGEVAGELHADSHPPREQELLTAREREIMLLVGSAMSNKEIARKLRISDNTVKTHLHRIYVKLNRSGRYKALLSDAVGASPVHLPADGTLQPGRIGGS